MTRTFDSESFEAFSQLLARPDAADLPRRAHACRFAGDPDRRATRLPAILMGWLQRRHLHVDMEELPGNAAPVWIRRPAVPAPGLSVLCPTQTS